MSLRGIESSLWGCAAPGTGGALCVWVVVCVVRADKKLARGGRADTQAPETVVSEMSGRRAGSVFARDRCHREE